MIIHDYSSLHWPGVEKAVDEFFADKPEPVVSLPDVCGSVVIRKARMPGRDANWLIQKRLQLLSEDWAPTGNDHIREILGAGWSNPEAWGIWGVGGVHELQLAIPAGSAGLLDLDVHAALVGSRSSQTVEVFADGRKVATWEFASTNNRAVRSIRIAASDTHTTAPISVTVELRPASVARPCDLDPNATEGRLLGIALHRIRRRVDLASGQ